MDEYNKTIEYSFTTSLMQNRWVSFPWFVFCYILFVKVWIHTFSFVNLFQKWLVKVFLVLQIIFNMQLVLLFLQWIVIIRCKEILRKPFIIFVFAFADNYFSYMRYNHWQNIWKENLVKHQKVSKYYEKIVCKVSSAFCVFINKSKC